MEYVEINWKRAKIVLFILYVLLLSFPLALAFINYDISIFLASGTCFSVIAYYLYSRIKYAEEHMSVLPKNMTAKEKLSFNMQFMGGPLKLVAYILGSTFAAILVIVLFNVF